MEDREIIDLYFSRDERAIRETEIKYASYLRKIAWNILGNIEDCRECENDTYLKAWNTIPPNNPPVFPAYLAKIVRESAIDRWRLIHRKKRGGTELMLSLSELTEVASSEDSPEGALDGKMLASDIEAYLKSISREMRTVFLMRYFYLDPIRNIAKATGFSQSKIKSMLFRARQGLREYLEKEGYTI